MKKTLCSFAVVAGFVAVLLLGCSKPVKTICTPNEDIIVGGYNGEFSILSGAYTFDDSLTVSNIIPGDRKINIKSERLGTVLTGTFDETDCNKVLLDTITIASQVIETVTLNNIKATGIGIISGNSISVIINIKSGSALIGSFNVPLANQSLTGLFTK